MAIFRKDTNGVGDSDTSATARGEASLSIIAAGMKITGDIDTDGVIKIEGQVDGAIRAGRQVLIERQGHVHGDIHTREAILGGSVEGIITASERIEVQGTATVLGDIHTRAIAVVEGGRINGTIRISDSSDSNHRVPETSFHSVATSSS